MSSADPWGPWVELPVLGDDATWEEEAARNELLDKVLVPGNQIRVKDVVLLVGDVNKRLGRCDCCGPPRRDVRAYRVKRDPGDPSL